MNARWRKPFTIAPLVGVWAITAAVSGCQSDPCHRAAEVASESPPTMSVAPHLPAAAHLANFPARPKNAAGGRAFLTKTSRMLPAQREEAIYAEIVSGNVPDHLRAMLPVTLKTVARDGSLVTGTAWVLPDYLAVGSDDDYVRVPINEFTATRLAARLGLALPTQKLVNTIYSQATVFQLPTT